MIHHYTNLVRYGDFQPIAALLVFCFLTYATVRSDTKILRHMSPEMLPFMSFVLLTLGFARHQRSLRHSIWMMGIV